MKNKTLAGFADKRFGTLKELREALAPYGVEIPHLEIEESGKAVMEDPFFKRYSFKNIKLFAFAPKHLANTHEEYKSLDDFIARNTSEGELYITTYNGRMEKFNYRLAFHGHKGDVSLVIGNTIIADLGCPA